VPTALVWCAGELHPVVSEEVYRIGYEAIRNACVHSRASRIDVALEYGHDLTLRVTDDGVGIEGWVIETGKEGHFGLQCVSLSLTGASPFAASVSGPVAVARLERRIAVRCGTPRWEAHG